LARRQLNRLRLERCEARERYLHKVAARRQAPRFISTARVGLHGFYGHTSRIGNRDTGAGNQCSGRIRHVAMQSCCSRPLRRCGRLWRRNRRSRCLSACSEDRSQGKVPPSQKAKKAMRSQIQFSRKSSIGFRLTLLSFGFAPAARTHAPI